ncbi:MAG: hypothetical protein JSW67_05900 [Candidatus Latescibacterota bacterium]|nr:MAG: hypothetical protein JSW67_05900 [Candidatus Latescibacterota bacterium]
MLGSSSSDERRRRLSGLYPQLGRRYERVDLTAHRHRSRAARRRALLLKTIFESVVVRYSKELQVEPAMVEDFAHVVASRLRTEVRADWSVEKAEARAHEIAERLFEELDAPGNDSAAPG